MYRYITCTYAYVNTYKYDKSLQSCPTLCEPMARSLPSSSVHGILQARTLEWVAMPSPGDLPNPGIKPSSSVAPALQADSFTTEPPEKSQYPHTLYTYVCVYICIYTHVYNVCVYIYMSSLEGPCMHKS